MNTQYCQSRFKAIRRHTREIHVGHIGIGGTNPIRIQSMTNTSTLDVGATVSQTLALADVGCEIVRITAQNVKAAEALEAISKQVRAAGCTVPLVADIHFLPQAAMEAAKHVEKVRINPGNYADKKKFAVLEYTDAEYAAELERIHEKVTPLILRCKELGRCLRIGTNHGSLSDRIMNRYGDSPLGMVESALEFIRIAESHHFHNIVLSMKASNPKVMIEAYRLAALKMAEEDMYYPLHLGVTEAGDREDGRIKSAIGIGSLLCDGLGDTVRVSLTEDPVYEIPVAQDLARRAEQLWTEGTSEAADSIDPFDYKRRPIIELALGEDCPVGLDHPPRVVVHAGKRDPDTLVKEVLDTHKQLAGNKIEGLLLEASTPEDLKRLHVLEHILAPTIASFFLEVEPALSLKTLQEEGFVPSSRTVIVRSFDSENIATLSEWADWTHSHGAILAVDATAETLEANKDTIRELGPEKIIFTTSRLSPETHPTGTYRKLAECLKQAHIDAPLWIRNVPAFALDKGNYFTARLLDASILSGSLFCDGLGDIISVETEPDLTRATTLAYNLLQGSRMRMSKTEFVACPSCGRTLFDLETTTQRIRERTGHLKGVTLAIMGCIVNGPGEMADADFGYVGGAPGKVNLYVRKDCVQYGIPEEEAVDALIALIKSHNKWVEPETIHA